MLNGSKLYYTEETHSPDQEEDMDDDEVPEDVSGLSSALKG